MVVFFTETSAASHTKISQLEASEGRKRIIAVLDARATAVGSIPGSSRQSSYSTSQVDEEVMDDEVRRIYHTAQPTTKTLYDLAVDPELPERPNWIIRVRQSFSRSAETMFTGFRSGCSGMFSGIAMVDKHRNQFAQTTLSETVMSRHRPHRKLQCQ